MVCSIEGCGILAQGRGLCNKHYRRWYKYGDPTFLSGPLNRLPKGIAARNAVIRKYRKNAKQRQIDVSLSDAEFISLFEEICYYCGDKPSNEQYHERNNGKFIYNGIDRIDDSQGYHKFNVVPCCWTCNRMKQSMNAEDFVEHVEKIFRRISNGKSN